MSGSRVSSRFVGFLILLTVLGFTAVNCGERERSLTGIEAQFAKGGNGNGGGPKTESSNDGDPTVDSTDPSSAPQDTTLAVTVFGSGFDEGSTVEFLLDEESTDRIVTNSTAFVDSKTLVANITIAVDAIPDLYDVEVTTSKGKRGIGIELFEVQPAFKITFSSVDGWDGAEVLTTTACGPGFLVARMTNDDPWSLNVDGTSRMEFDDTLYPFLVTFGGLSVAWTREFDVGKGTSGNFGSDFGDERDCYGQTAEDHHLVGNLLLDIGEDTGGNPDQRGQHVHFHLVFDAYCMPDDNPNPGSCTTLEDFILSEGTGELTIVEGSFAENGSGWAVVEGMMEFEYYLSSAEPPNHGRQSIPGGGPMKFRFRIDIERIDASIL